MCMARMRTSGWALPLERRKHGAEGLDGHRDRLRLTGFPLGGLSQMCELCPLPFPGASKRATPTRFESVMLGLPRRAVLAGSSAMLATAASPFGAADAQQPKPQYDFVITGGEVIDASKLDQVVRSLAALPDPPPSVRRIPLWSHPVVGAAVITLLGVFWVGRKVIGLV